ncbi:TPA: hypothetical protein N6384_004519 [Escherichia coli]|nr:hypothetical protein [Escherichia coli]
MKTVKDIVDNRKDAVGKIFQLPESPIGLIIYVTEDDVYAIWNGNDTFHPGNGHLINTMEGEEPQPVHLLAHSVTIDELEDASKHIRSM